MGDLDFTREKIKNMFDEEFSHCAGKFKFFDITMDNAKIEARIGVAAPGVYVFWKADRVIKVGRSLVNTRMRALEHIRDDTDNKMAELKDDKDVHLLLFNLSEEKDKKPDLHWVAALEVFFEDNLEPQVRSKRRG